MKVPCCSVCQNRYNEEDRVPLLLHCGHGFCADCMSRMFLASSDSRLSCPRCRYVSVVGNSIQALRKNFAVLALIHSSSKTAVATSEFDCDFTDDDGDDGEGEVNGDEESLSRRRWSGGSCTSTSGGCGPVIDIGVHKDLKLLRQIGEGRRDGVEIWTAMLGGRGSGSTRCRHQVAVKKVAVGDDMDLGWVLEQLESLHRASMWCRNVCTFHGAMEMDGSLYLVMDRCYGSVQSKMQENEGRLTLEQILRYGADVARGVAELHAAGVVCMNIKPSNLLLDATGHAVVSDYGLAAILKKPMCSKGRSDCDSSRMHLCMECAMLSPHYAAPEAWEPVKKSLTFWDDGLGMSVESDAWSFACTLVEMCTGSIPWSGLCTDEIYRAVVKAKKLPPQYSSIVGVGIPRELWKMIGDCLQFKSLKRPTFNKMLTTFLRYLQEIPRSPSANPDNDLAKFSGLYITDSETSLMSDLEVFRYNLGHLHRLVFDGDFNGVRDLLVKAAFRNSSSFISKLLEAQNDEGQTALHLACRRGFAEIVEVILEFREAKVDILDKDGDPPLVFALAAGSPECVRILIERGANVCSRLREGFGPSVAHVCAYHGQPDCMRELLLAGADPNVVDDEGESVLHRAVTKKYSDCALVILENGGCRSMALLNAKHLTPLHMCVSTCNVIVVKKWIEIATAEEIAEAIDIPSSAGTALCMAAALKKDRERGNNSNLLIDIGNSCI